MESWGGGEYLSTNVFLLKLTAIISYLLLMGWPLEGNLPRWMAWAHASSNWSERGQALAGRPECSRHRAPGPAFHPSLPEPQQLWRWSLAGMAAGNEAGSWELQLGVYRELPFLWE